MAPLSYQRRLYALALLPGLAPLIVAVALVWAADVPRMAAAIWAILLALSWVGLAALLWERALAPIRVAANALGAIREDDFSLRVREDDPDDAFGLLAREVNAIGTWKSGGRLEEIQASVILARIMDEIDAALFAFDGQDRLVLSNRSGERLLGRAAADLKGAAAGELGLGLPLVAESGAVLDLVFPGGGGRWEARRAVFRLEGRPHRLLVLSDLSRVLREQERTAWQRLVRVLSHEINNSLAPIRSIAQNLRVRQGGNDAQLDEGLEVIAGRSEALARFLSSYARLARLPPPKKASVDVADWVERVTRLETRVPIEVAGGPDVEIQADGDQLDQLLINLLDNARDAMAETGGCVRIEWTQGVGTVDLRVLDEGTGITKTANLFVPFYTTKAEGSGIGLALGRQIAEVHGGTLTLENRADGAGCVATVRLPARDSASRT